MQDSLYTKIIKGEIPCQKVYEDERTIAFLDIHPIVPGHVLVVSKKQTDHLWDLPDKDYFAVMATVKKVANRIREVLEPKGRVGVHVEGLGVPHAHVHVFPFETVEEFRRVADHSAEPDYKALAEMAKKLAF
jgi:histidine triad (HIT) family protein